MLETRRFRTWVTCAVCGLWLAGCVLSREDQERTPNPAAGLYTPDSLLGAGDPSDLLPPLGALGDRCVRPGESPEGAIFTAGTLKLDYRTQTIDGQYAPANATAVWIEDANDQYVATLEVNALLRLPGLRCYQMRACQDKLGPDVVSSASRDDHMKPHEGLEWNGVDFDGMPVPDGEYRLYIEITETDKADGDCLDYSFVKGPEASSRALEVDVGTALLDGSLTWMPAAPGGF